MSSKNKEENNKKQKYYITLGVIILLILLSILAIFLVNNKQKENENEIAYTELIKEINDGNIEKIEMTVGSTRVKVKLRNLEEEKKAVIPSTQPFVELIQEKVENKIKVDWKQSEDVINSMKQDIDDILFFYLNEKNLNIDFNEIDSLIETIIEITISNY